MRSIDIEQIDSHRHRNNSGSNNNISNSKKRKNDPAPEEGFFFTKMLYSWFQICQVVCVQ